MTDLTLTDASPGIATVRLAAAGDQAAFARLVSEHHAAMARVAYAITGNADMAADVTQVAWAAAWRRLGSLREPSTVRAWLVAIAANEARQVLRRNRARSVVDISTVVDIGGLFGQAATVDYGDGRQLVIVRDPLGLATPCVANTYAAQPVASADQFAAYLKTIPGFTVQSTEHRIDGHRAVLLAVASAPTGDCTGQITLFRGGSHPGMRSPSDVLKWSTNAGSAFSLWIVEVGSERFLFWWQGPGVQASDELGLMSSVRFLTALPTSP